MIKFESDGLEDFGRRKKIVDDLETHPINVYVDTHISEALVKTSHDDYLNSVLTKRNLIHKILENDAIIRRARSTDDTEHTNRLAKSQE